MEESAKNMMSLYNKLKPKDPLQMARTSNFIDVLIKLQNGEIDISRFPKAIMLLGTHGCGKSLSAEIFTRIINNIDSDYELDDLLVRINTGNYNKIDDAREFESLILNSRTNFFGKYMVFVFEEAHNLKKHVQELFKSLIDMLYGNIFVIFTSVYGKEAFIPDLYERFTKFIFNPLSDINSIKNFLIELNNRDLNENGVNVDMGKLLQPQVLKKIYDITSGRPRDLINIYWEFQTTGTISVTSRTINGQDNISEKNNTFTLFTYFRQGELGKFIDMYRKMISDENEDIFNIHYQLTLFFSKYIIEKIILFKSDDTRMLMNKIYRDLVDAMNKIRSLDSFSKEILASYFQTIYTDAIIEIKNDILSKKMYMNNSSGNGSNKKEKYV